MSPRESQEDQTVGKSPQKVGIDHGRGIDRDEQSRSASPSSTELSSHNAPSYELRQVFTDGSQDARLCTYAELLEAASKVRMGRRAFLGLSSLTTLAALAACSGDDDEPMRVAVDPPTERPAEPVEAIEPVIEEPEQPVALQPSCEDLRAHTEGVVDLAFSHDSRLLASTGQDHTVKLWNLETGETPHLIDEQPNPPGEEGPSQLRPIFSQDGERLYWLAPDENALKVYSLEEGTTVGAIWGLGGFVWGAAFNHDETRWVVVGREWLEVWDMESVRSLWRSDQIVTPIDVFFTSDDRFIYTGDTDGLIHKWDAETGELLDAIASENGVILGLRISPDGSKLVWGGSESNMVTIWDIAAGEIIDGFNAPGGIAVHNAFSQDGRWLASAGDLSLISIIEVETSMDRYLLEAPGNEVRELHFSPDGRTLVAGTDIGSIVLWNTETFDQLDGKPNDCLFDPNTTPVDSEFNAYQITDAENITRTYSLPCGAPIPAGAICTCNCVPGTFAGTAPVAGGDRPSSGSGGRTCSCDEVCTCVPVCICMAV